MFNRSSDSDLVMPVSPMGYGGGSNGFLGGDGIWALLIFALIFNGGFGGFGGWGNGIGGFAADGAMLYPWMNQSEVVNSGFQNQMLQTSIQGVQNSITSGFGDVNLGIAGINQNICNTGNAVVGAVTGAQNALTQQMYTNQIADLERSFAAQTASTQGMNTLQGQLAQCCCDQRLSTAQTQALVQSENCADRYEAAQNTAAIINAINGGIQSVKDQMCADKIDEKNDTIAQLRSELLYARGQASQDVQTAVIQSGQRALANEVEQYVAPRPIPSYIVQNPSCCYNGGCGNF